MSTSGYECGYCGAEHGEAPCPELDRPRPRPGLTAARAVRGLLRAHLVACQLSRLGVAFEFRPAGGGAYEFRVGEAQTPFLDAALGRAKVLYPREV